MNLRKEAQNRECQIRAPGCTFDNSQTVLAHLGGAGMGAKHNDILGAWSCHHCHDLVDGRMPDATISTTMRRLYHLTGIVRTQDILIAEGKIRAK